MSNPQLGGRNNEGIPKQVMARIFWVLLLAPVHLTFLICLLVPRHAYNVAFAVSGLNCLLILSTSPFCAWWLACKSSRNSAARIITGIIFFLALVGTNLCLLFIAFVNLFGLRV
ncbi:hypothetical protein Cflav_PD5052 [Pedosphaera parvula Ellin514]|uniref:Uncharacterized protein n=1 Tax=Pedosphaera parvula (strain Ellin514) TaxID=320771 RepID=B9XBU9_PEDPL|nr:hypothetical protein Cflav_PD5052 [Pedosphaera parvula Ellin514]